MPTELSGEGPFSSKTGISALIESSNYLYAVIR